MPSSSENNNSFGKTSHKLVLPKRILYLASSSPRRSNILKKHNISFTLIKNKLKTEKIPTQYKRTPEKAISLVAKEKVLASKKQYQGLILGIDTTIIFKETFLGKPSAIEHAKQMLQSLSGKTHQVVSGFYLYDSINKVDYIDYETTTVEFNHLSIAQIENYCHNYKILDKAGAYAIQDIGPKFIKTITGSYDNVVGFPTEKLLKLFSNYDIVGDNSS